MQIERTDNFMASLGVEAYRVGGSVRDEILGRQPKDADYIVRGLDLHQLYDVLDRSERVGKITPLKLRQGGQFGWRMNGVEIALPRSERSTGPGRDMEVTVDPALPLAEDAKRRDFTFNALYKYLPDGPVVDPTSRGLYDLQHKLVNITHSDSFRDDPLRMLRALRFVSTLGYDLGAETYAMMQADADTATGLTANGYASGTIYDEFSKMLMGQHPHKALRIARDTGVLAVVMPELAAMLGFDQGSQYHDLTTCEHTFVALKTAARVDAPLRVRWALLFHDAGKPESAWKDEHGNKHYYAKDETEDHEVVGERLWRDAAARMTGVPKPIREDVATIIRHHMVPVKTRNVGTRVRRMRVQFGDDLLHDLLMHRMCDLTGKGHGHIVKNAMQHIVKMEFIRAGAQSAGTPASTKDLQIAGKDIVAMGAAGRRVGEIQRRVLDEVVCEPTGQMLTREWQLKRVEALARADA